MTCRLSRRLLQSVKRTTRYFSQAAPEAATVENTPQITKLPNLTVATWETGFPVARLGAVVGVGSRHEKPAEVGMSHLLRQSATVINRGFSDVVMTGTIAHMGGDLSCTGTRENMYYEIGYLKSENANNEIESFLESILTMPQFYEWHMKNPLKQMSFDVSMANLTPEIKLMEMVHEAAYRTTLGRSLFIPSKLIGRYSQEDMLAFFYKFFTEGNVCLVGLNVDHDSLVNMARTYDLAENRNLRKKQAAYNGGEMWLAMEVPMTYATVVTEGPSSADNKSVLVASVLQSIMGSGPHLKYCANNNNSRLTKAIQKVTQNPFTVSGVNVNYSDSGLFGFTAMSQPKDMARILKAAFKTFAGLTKSGITADELQAGKNRTKASVAMNLESQDVLWRMLADQVFMQGKYTPVDELFKIVDSITVDDVNNMAKKVVNGKPTLAVVGNLYKVPTLEELLK